MPRRSLAGKRSVMGDPKYGDRLITRFINGIMLAGKKSVAEKIFYQALDIIQEKTKGDPVKIFKRAVENVKPVLEVRSRRVGGATYQIPLDVRPDRRTALGIRWIVSHARSRNERSMQDRLAAELLDASDNQGNSVKKKEDTHKMAEANKAFAHYRW